MKPFTYTTVVASAVVILGLGTLAPMAAYAQSTSGAPPAEAKAAPKKVASNDEVKALQEALDKAGYTLKADGRMGPKTRAALKKYQKGNGLKVTGKPDQATKEKLGVQ